MNEYVGSFSVARFLFQRALAGIYLIAFISAFNQFPALLGQNGLEPVPQFISRVPFSSAPSIFYLGYSDFFFLCVASIGIILSALAVLGIPEKGPLWVSMGIWLVLWALYLSIVSVGQTFYSFGWESMLVEAGFFAAFLGPRGIHPSIIPILILRWMLFRVELGAGLIKLRYDQCWRDFTCLFYHYETQPMPNPLSWYFHYIPHFFQRCSVLFSHVVQLVMPFGLLGPQPVAAVAAGLIVFHQFLLVISGNYSWLNWLTIALGVTALSDAYFAPGIVSRVQAFVVRPQFYDGILYALALVTALLSINPVLNLLSRDQHMNYNYNSLQLVNSYGAFGSVTKARYEIIIEGTDESSVTPRTVWKAYEFKGKPGDVMRMPPQIAPYHLRLDWLMWFLPFSVNVTDEGVVVPGYERWFMRFIEKLLEGDAKTLRLLRLNPFVHKPPAYIRAQFYRYHYTTWQERKKTGAWWKRTLVGAYLPPVKLSDIPSP